MGLVRDLEAKEAAERRKLLEATLSYLQNLRIDARLIEEPAMYQFGMDINESVIQIKGQNINHIRLNSADFVSCGVMGSISRFQYEVTLDKKLTHKSSQQIRARTKSVKEQKKLGLFGGRITGVNWIGKGLAELLNSDNEISKILLACARAGGEPEFKVQTKPPSSIDILGPRFIKPQRIMDLLAADSKERFEECIFGYKICDRIARHARELATTW